MTAIPTPPATRSLPSPGVTVGALLRISLFYGIAGFGGGYSVLAQLRRDLVERRRWVDPQEFLELAELSKSLPGTAATSLLALLGQRVGGLRGGLVAATAFLLPSAALMTACGAAYSWMRKASALTVFFDGMNAAMVGVVGAVTIDLARSALRSRRDVALAAACALLLATRVVSEPALAVCAAFVGGTLASLRSGGSPPENERLHALGWPALFFGAGGLEQASSLFRVFVPIGIMTFGGGLAMIPAIEHEVVDDLHWLGPKAFADAIALGQITPGPVAICATFIGYRVAGVVGALVATVAMFGPAIGLALLAGHSVARFRRSPVVAGALHALAPAVIGMLAAATFSLARAGVEDPTGAAVALVTLGVLVRFSISPLWPLAAGGLIHLTLATVRHP